MKSKLNLLTVVVTTVLLSQVGAQAASLETLIEGSTADTQVVASQQTRLSAAIESLLKKIGRAHV